MYYQFPSVGQFELYTYIFQQLVIEGVGAVQLENDVARVDMLDDLALLAQLVFNAV